MKTIFKIVFLILFTAPAFGQVVGFEKEINELADTQLGLNAKVQLSVSWRVLSRFHHGHSPGE